ncbi:MAG TPA: hypothetical protein VN628_10510, partial [Vicinamibacterales bacterium]|nr:hypothetical protein [Vicinamibacterales bacterium]
MKRAFFTVAAAVATVSAGQTNAYAQGCVLIREAAPVIGSLSSTYLRPGEWQLDVSFRDSTATRHYSLDVEQVQRQTLGTYVTNKQRQMLFSVSHSVTDRFSYAVNVPVISASWSIPSPTAPTPGPRAVQHGDGLGDISAVGRYWIFDPATHASRNLSIGLGVKAPTGPSNVTDTFVDISGLNSATKAVDQSVQPGDG